ncbi:MAG: hypothetical protein AMXMBFR7_12100 [Planctomycetota bacterium]
MRFVTLPLPAELDGDLWLRPREYDYVPPERRRGHCHAELEFNLVTRGSAVYLIGGRRVELRPRMLLWLFPAQPHLQLGESPDYAAWIAVFRPRLLKRVCRTEAARTLRRSLPPDLLLRRLNANAADALDRLFAPVALAREQAELFNAGLAHALLATWQAFAATEDARPGLDVHPAVERAAMLLREERLELALPELAARAGLSPARLSRLFKRQTGVSLAQYRNRCRVERFRECFGAGQRLSLLQAALEAGFGSYAQFHRVFTAQMGIGPLAYRRKVRQEQA